MHEEKVWKWPNYILERMPNYSIRHKGKKKKKTTIGEDRKICPCCSKWLIMEFVLNVHSALVYWCGHHNVKKFSTIQNTSLLSVFLGMQIQGFKLKSYSEKIAIHSALCLLFKLPMEYTYFWQFCILKEQLTGN